MRPCLPASIAVLVTLLSGCGGDSAADPAAATGGLGEAECRLIVDRYRDFAVESAKVSGNEAQMRSMIEAGMGMMVDDCVAGESFDREAYDCVAAAPAGSQASHDCIQAANERG